MGFFSSHRASRTTLIFRMAPRATDPVQPREAQARPHPRPTAPPIRLLMANSYRDLRLFKVALAAPTAAPTAVAVNTDRTMVCGTMVVFPAVTATAVGAA